MAINRRTMPLSPSAVWAVLADGFTYARWVVGTREIRNVDEHFPAVGSRLHYTVGHGPVRHEGHTEVVAIDEGRRLELQIVAWPAGAVKVVMSLEPKPAGMTEVTMVEHPVKGLGAVLHNPLGDLLLRLRNVETLRRLQAVATSHDGSTAAAHR
jgi:uncharacterized protein YndB with AHSA1/START domain